MCVCVYNIHIIYFFCFLPCFDHSNPTKHCPSSLVFSSSPSPVKENLVPVLVFMRMPTCPLGLGITRPPQCFFFLFPLCMPYLHAEEGLCSTAGAPCLPCHFKAPSLVGAPGISPAQGDDNYKKKIRDTAVVVAVTLSYLAAFLYHFKRSDHWILGGCGWPGAGAEASLADGWAAALVCVTLGLAEPCPGRNNLSCLGTAPWQVSEWKPDNCKPLSSLKCCKVFKLLYFHGLFNDIFSGGA